MIPTRAIPARPIDRTPWCTLLHDRFGIPDSVFDGYHFYQFSKKYITIIPKGTLLDLSTTPLTAGLYLIKANLAFPKMTTQATMIFGHHATLNTITLDADQVRAYIQRQDLALTIDQQQQCHGTGYVLVRYRGRTLGKGIFFDQAEGLNMRSLFPKNWAGIHHPLSPS